MTLESNGKHHHVSFLLNKKQGDRSEAREARMSLTSEARASLSRRPQYPPATGPGPLCCWMASSKAMMGGGSAAWPALVLSLPSSRIWSKLVPSTSPFSFFTGLLSPFSTVIRGLKQWVCI